MNNYDEELKKVKYHVIDTLKHVRAANENLQRLLENYEKDFLSFPNIIIKIDDVIDRYPNTVIGKICANSFKYSSSYIDNESAVLLFIKDLTERIMKHDLSKISGLEYEGYKDVVFKLAGLEHGTKEHTKAIAELDEPFKLHAKANRHHPEYFSVDNVQSVVEKMDIVDFTEMILDWTAAAICRGFKFRLSSVEHKRETLDLDDITVEIIQRNIKLILPEDLVINDIKK